MRVMVRVIDRSQRRDEEVHSGTTVCCVQANAGLCVSVVGDLGAGIGLQRGIGFARGHDPETAGHEE